MNNAASGPRVLLVEDEMLVAGMLQGMLSSLGYVVAGPAADAAEVMEMLDREGVDAVVLDINLNGQMSYSIADELVVRGIPFIFSTGYEPQSLPENHAGRPVLKKPFRRSALGSALADLLRADREAPDRPRTAGDDLLAGLAQRDSGSPRARRVGS